MSKSNKEHYQKLQQGAFEELKELKEEFNKISAQLDEMEHNSLIKEYIELKYRWDIKSKLVSSAKERLGLWTYILIIDE